MNGFELGQRFWESTRGQVVALLRRGALTVDELAQQLGVTDNAVRSHLSALERDRLVRQDGVRRGVGAGKPAIRYELDPDVAPLFSRAYAPTLATVIDVLVDELPVPQRETVLRTVGQRLARDLGGLAPGDTSARVQAAAAILVSLGADIAVEQTTDGWRLRGSGCPLSVVVSRRPEMCRALESLVGELVGQPTPSCCEHGAQPKCCFAVLASESRT